MEQFSLEKYLENPNRKVVTRDGNSVRIICTDRVAEQPIVALVQIKDRESLVTYTANGEYYMAGTATDLDLFFAPVKKEGWIKVYYGKSRCNTFVCNRIFATKEEAEKQKNDGVVAIIKIEWEE